MAISLNTKLKATGGEAPFFNEALPHPGYIAGKYYLPDHMFASVTSGNTVADQIYFMPFVPRETHTFDRLALANTGAGDAGDKCRLGIYTAGADGLPDSRVVDGGEIVFGGAAALNTVTISQSLSANTLYWLCAVFDAIVTVLKTDISVASTPMISNYGLETTRINVSMMGAILESHAYAALPAFSGGTFTATTDYPTVLLRG